MVVFVEALGVCGSKRGHRGKIGESMREWARGMELLLLGIGCPGQRPDVRGLRRMSGRLDRGRTG